MFIYRDGIDLGTPVCTVDSESYQRAYRFGRESEMFSASFDQNIQIDGVIKFIMDNAHMSPDRKGEFSYKYLKPIRNLDELRTRQEVIAEVASRQDIESRVALLAQNTCVETWNEMYFSEKRKGYRRNHIHAALRAVDFVEAGSYLPGEHERLVAIRNFAQDISKTAEYKELKLLSEGVRPLVDLDFQDTVNRTGGINWNAESLIRRFSDIFGRFSGEQNSEEAQRFCESFSRGFAFGDIERKRFMYMALTSFNEVFIKLIQDKRFAGLIDRREADVFQLSQELNYGVKRLATSSWVDESASEYIPENDLFFLKRFPEIIDHVYELIDDGLEKRMRKLEINTLNLSDELTFYYVLANTSNRWKGMGYPVTMPKLHEMSAKRNRINDGCVPSLVCSGMKDVVPNDIDFSATKHLFSIEGPNQNGKTTYLRMIGQMQYLAQIGSFLPAREAEVSLIDGIFTSFGKKDKENKGEGTYLAQLDFSKSIFAPSIFDDMDENERRRLIKELYSKGKHGIVTPYSLVLLDEIAIGTDSHETLNRARVILEESVKRGQTLYLSTHCHEIGDLVESGAIKGAVNLGSMVESKEGKVKYTRKVVEGKREKSYGNLLAEEAGVVPRVLEEGRKTINDALFK